MYLFYKNYHLKQNNASEYQIRINNIGLNLALFFFL